MSHPRILVTRRWPLEVEHELMRRWPSVQLNPSDRPMTAPELAEALATNDVVCSTITDTVAGDVLAGPIESRLLANYGAGVDHIDVEAVRLRGVTVTNTPDVVTEATAELAILLMLMLARRAAEGTALVRSGAWSGWRPVELMGTGLRGQVLGIVGMGRIGRAVSHLAAAHGMEVIYWNRSTLPEGPAIAKQRSSMDEVLAQADFVSVHTPGMASRPVIGSRELSLMKPTAFLINTARGSCVDEHALVEALDADALAGAGLDVYRSEPQVPAALRTRANVVALPHLGSATRSARVAMGHRVIANIVAFLEGKPCPDLVT